MRHTVTKINLERKRPAKHWDERTVVVTESVMCDMVNALDGARDALLLILRAKKELVEDANEHLGRAA